MKYGTSWTTTRIGSNLQSEESPRGGERTRNRRGSSRRERQPHHSPPEWPRAGEQSKMQGCHTRRLARRQRHRLDLREQEAELHAHRSRLDTELVADRVELVTPCKELEQILEPPHPPFVSAFSLALVRGGALVVGAPDPLRGSKLKLLWDYITIY